VGYAYPFQLRVFSGCRLALSQRPAQAASTYRETWAAARKRRCPAQVTLERGRDGVNAETNSNAGVKAMSETAYSYATHLNIKFDPLKLIDVSALAKEVADKWYNQTLCKVNDSVVRLGVMQGEYHWHKHDNDDEFFFVLSGKFIVDLEDRSVELLPDQGFVVPKGVMHCTRAPEKSIILMVETAAIVPTGD
jgi:mannose-6-phosphate isomerase-like protein (cupin superfamily)